MIAQSRECNSMRGECLGQNRVLVTALKSMDCISRYSFCLNDTTLSEQCSRASIVNLGNHSLVLQGHEKVTSAVHMLVCFIIFSDREEQITEIILNPSEIASVSS